MRRSSDRPNECPDPCANRVDLGWRIAGDFAGDGDGALIGVDFVEINPAASNEFDPKYSFLVGSLYRMKINKVSISNRETKKGDGGWRVGGQGEEEKEERKMRREGEKNGGGHPAVSCSGVPGTLTRLGILVPPSNMR